MIQGFMHAERASNHNKAPNMMDDFPIWASKMYLIQLREYKKVKASQETRVEEEIFVQCYKKCVHHCIPSVENHLF